ncbi:MAG: hypothetical protein ABIJ97_00405 [Bacteroidota bacterium]
MESYFNNKGVFGLITKWKYHIIIIVVISMIAATIFSSPFFIKPKYKSVGIIYPVNLSTLSDESETEQLLQILQSQEIREDIYKSFNLAKHYGLDSLHPYFKTLLNSYFDDNVSFRKTEYESVEISVMDVNPKFACSLVDSLIVFYNKKVSELSKFKYGEVVEISTHDMKKKQIEIDTLTVKLNSIRKDFGILDYKIQTQEATRYQGNSTEMTKLLENLKEKGGEYRTLDSLLWNAQKKYFELKNWYEVNVSNYEKNITYCHVVSKPYVSDKKAFPVRWVIVLLSAIGSLFMSIIIVSLIESARKNKVKQ